MARALILLLLGVVSLATALPAVSLKQAPTAACSTVNTRKEWHDLTIPQRKEFIAAIKCLQSTPGQYKNVHGIDQLTAYEDFVYQHKFDTAYVHYVGHFLAWHRYYLYTYEQSLRDKCGYTGYLPYWDQKLDRANSSASVIFDADHGFGGNGIKQPQFEFPGGPPAGTGGGCVTTGPFSQANYVLRLARMNSPTRQDHCLERNLNPAICAHWSTPEREQALMVKDTYDGFVKLLEGGPGGLEDLGVHGGGHGTISGAMTDPFVSPGDPLFFMHHANIDRIWRDWQKVDLAKRLYQISGSPIPWTTALGPDLNQIPKNTPTTLEYPVTMGLLGPDRTVNDLMDVTGGFLCYDYA